MKAWSFWYPREGFPFSVPSHLPPNADGSEAAEVLEAVI